MESYNGDDKFPSNARAIYFILFHLHLCHDMTTIQSYLPQQTHIYMEFKSTTAIHIFSLLDLVYW